MQGLRSISAHLWAPKQAGVSQPLLILSLCWGLPRMQGLHSNSALFWVPEKAFVFFCSNTSPNLCLPINLEKILNFFVFLLREKILQTIFFTGFYYILLCFTAALTRFYQMPPPQPPQPRGFFF